jgi:hypothetical protein
VSRKYSVLTASLAGTWGSAIATAKDGRNRLDYRKPSSHRNFNPLPEILDLIVPIKNADRSDEAISPMLRAIELERL